MLLFTWNLKNREAALKVALTNLERRARDDSVIACFQEVPPSDLRSPAKWRAAWAPLWERLRNELGLDRLRVVAGPVGAGRLVMVYSADLRPGHPRCDANERMLFVRFRTASGSEIVIVGYHAVDRLNYSVAEARGGYQALARREIDERVPSSLVPVVLLGDFNASPGMPELGDRACLYVLGPRERHNSRAEKHFDRVSPPLYAVAPEGSEGTIFVEWGRRAWWETYDFVAVTHELRDRVTSRILPVIGGVSLIHPYKATPNKETYSDHLPVEAELQFT